MATDSRTGIGVDVHAFSAKRRLVIGGVVIPDHPGLEGHSDADVLVHAIIDAVLGACALGDIGTIFPDTDPRFKDADSIALLRSAVSKVESAGFSISFIDSTIIAQSPQFSPYIAKMRERIASVSGVEPDRVSVKAKTTEHLGFIGRKEGVAAIAVATVVRDGGMQVAAEESPRSRKQEIDAEETGLTVLKHAPGTDKKDSELRSMLQSLSGIVINTDGSSLGNPGQSGCSAVICDEGGMPLLAFAWHIGETTNNVAEYRAILGILNWLSDLEVFRLEIEIRSDSELVVKQLNGAYKVKSPLLQDIYSETRLLQGRFTRLRIRYVPREANTIADKLAKGAAGGWKKRRQ